MSLPRKDQIEALIEQITHIIEKELDACKLHKERWEIYRDIILKLTQQLLLEIGFAHGKKEVQKVAKDLCVDIDHFINISF